MLVQIKAVKTAVLVCYFVDLLSQLTSDSDPTGTCPI